MTMVKCLICGKRPGASAQFYCSQCYNHLEGEKRARKERAQEWLETADQFVLYKDNVLGMYPMKKSPDDEGPRLARVAPVYRSIKAIPEHKLIDLNRYCPGFTREQVKVWKRLFRQLYG